MSAPRSATPKRRAKTSPIHYFGTLDAQNNTFSCNHPHCESKWDTSTYGYYTAARRHFETIHSYDVSKTHLFSSHAKGKALAAADVVNMFGLLVINKNLPMAAFDWPELRAIAVQGFNVNLPHANVFHDRVLDPLVQRTKEQVVSLLELATSKGTLWTIVTDGWNRRNPQNSKHVVDLCVLGLFEGSTLKLSLGTHSIERRTTSVSLLRQVLRNLGVQYDDFMESVVAVAVDSAERAAVEPLGVLVVPCSAHTLALSAKDAEEPFGALLERARVLCRALILVERNSTDDLAAASVEEALAESLHEGSAGFIMDCPTRWFSTINMLTRLLSNKAKALRLCPSLALSDGEWADLERFTQDRRKHTVFSQLLCGNGVGVTYTLGTYSWMMLMAYALPLDGTVAAPGGDDADDGVLEDALGEGGDPERAVPRGSRTVGEALGDEDQQDADRDHERGRALYVALKQQQLLGVSRGNGRHHSTNIPTAIAALALDGRYAGGIWLALPDEVFLDIVHSLGPDWTDERLTSEKVLQDGKPCGGTVAAMERLFEVVLFALHPHRASSTSDAERRASRQKRRRLTIGADDHPEEAFDPIEAMQYRREGSDDNEDSRADEVEDDGQRSLREYRCYVKAARKVSAHLFSGRGQGDALIARAQLMASTAPYGKAFDGADKLLPLYLQQQQQRYGQIRTSAVASERHFSRSGRLDNLARNRMKDATMSKLLLINLNQNVLIK